MNIIITENAFYEILEREKRRVRIPRDSAKVKWLDTFQGLISSYDVPFTDKIIKILHGGEKELQAFHTTEFNKLKQFLNLIGKENALSSFIYMSGSLLENIRGIQTEGGVMFLINGVSVFNAPKDIMSKPDEYGRRWINAKQFGDNIYREIEKLIYNNEKYNNSESYINKILYEKIKSGKISEIDKEKYKTTLIYRLLVQYQEDCYEIIKKYSDEPYFYQYQDERNFSGSWSESLIQKIKIKKVLIGIFKLKNYENYRIIKRKNPDLITETDKLLVEKFESQVNEYVDLLKNHVSEDNIFKAYDGNDAIKFVESNGGYSDRYTYQEKEKIVFEKLTESQKIKIINFKLSKYKILSDSEFNYLDKENKIKYINYVGTLSLHQFKSLDDELIKFYASKRSLTNEQFDLLNDELQSYYIDILINNKEFLDEEDEVYIKDSVRRKYIIYKIKNGKRISIDVLKNLDEELKKIYIQNINFSLSNDEIELLDKSLLPDLIERLLENRISVPYDTYYYFNEDQQSRYIQMGFHSLTDKMFEKTTEKNKYLYLEKKLERYHSNLTELQLGYLDEKQIISYYKFTLNLPESIVNKLSPENKIKYYQLKIDNRKHLLINEIDDIFKNADLLKSYIDVYLEIDENKLDSLSSELFEYYINQKISNRRKLSLKEFKKCSEEIKIKYLTSVIVVLSDIFIEGENENIFKLNVINKIKISYVLTDEEYLLLNDEQKREYLRLRFRLTSKQIENTPEPLLIEYANDFHSRKSEFIPELLKYLEPDVVNSLIKRGLIDERYTHLLSSDALIPFYRNKIRRFERIPIAELIKLPLEDQFLYFDRIEFIKDEEQISKLPPQTQDQLKLVKIKKGYDLSDEEFVSSGHDVKSYYVDKFYDRISKEKIESLPSNLKSKLVAKRYKGGVNLSDEEFGYLDKKQQLSYLSRVDKTDEDFDKIKDKASKVGYLMDKLTKGKNVTKHQFDFLPKIFLKQLLNVGVKTTSDVFSFLTDEEKNIIISNRLKKVTLDKMEPHEKKWYDENKEKVKLSEMINEEMFYYNNLSKDEKDKVYDLFKNAYIKSTGKAWSRDKFDIKASRWTFYGLKNEGFIAVRKQGGNLNKLNGSAGNLRGISVGMKDLIETNEPIWGISTFEIRNILTKKFGLISPPPMVARIILSLIPKSVFGGSITKINSDGSMTIDYDDVGTAKKYFFANKQYFQESIPKLMGISSEKSPIKMKIINAFLKTIL